MVCRYRVVGIFERGEAERADWIGYVATMLEAGIPVVYFYIADAHDAEDGSRAFEPGEAGYVAQLKAYDDAWGKFFARLTAGKAGAAGGRRARLAAEALPVAAVRTRPGPGRYAPWRVVPSTRHRRLRNSHREANRLDGHNHREYLRVEGGNNGRASCVRLTSASR